MRFHTRAEQASTSLEQKHANAEQEIARLKAENNALAEVSVWSCRKCGCKSDSITWNAPRNYGQHARPQRPKRSGLRRCLLWLSRRWCVRSTCFVAGAGTNCAVASQASLRQRVNVQEAQLRRLELASRDGGSEDGVDSSDAPGSTSDMPPRPLASSGSSRRLSIAVSLRSPGSGPLLISPMQSPAVTPRSNTPRSDTSSPRRDSRVSETDATAAAKVYELQSEVAKLKYAHTRAHGVAVVFRAGGGSH